MTMKRLTDGCGARNGFGPKGRWVSSIAELAWWMEGLGSQADRPSIAAANVRGTRPFAKTAKERGTHCIGAGGDIKSLGHPACGNLCGRGILA